MKKGLLKAIISGAVLHEDDMFKAPKKHGDFSFMLNLKDGSEGTGIYMGTTIEYEHLYYDTYTSIVKENYNSVSAENSCKMNVIAHNSTDPNEFDFSKCETVANFAKDNGMKFRGHTLIQADETTLPDYIRYKTEADKEMIEQFMQDYINQTVTMFKGKAQEWDVISEPLNDDGSLRKNGPWQYVDDYICKAFKWAHEADPDAKLFINEDNVLSAKGDTKQKSEALYKLVKDLKGKGCPIDGVGFLSHYWNGYWKDQDLGDGDIKKNIRRYEDIGVETMMTEVEVQCADCDTEEWNKTAMKTQAKSYMKLLKICLKEENCKAFNTWGFTDAVTKMPDMHPLPFNAKYEKKPAYWAMLFQLNNYRDKHVKHKKEKKPKKPKKEKEQEDKDEADVENLINVTQEKFLEAKQQEALKFIN